MVYLLIITSLLIILIGFEIYKRSKTKQIATSTAVINNISVTST